MQGQAADRADFVNLLDSCDSSGAQSDSDDSGGWAQHAMPWPGTQVGLFAPALL